MIERVKEKGRVRHLTRSLRRLGRSVGRRKRDAIARQAMGDQKIRTHVLTILGREIRKELKRMCAITKPSMLRASTPEALASFNWNKLESELESRAPSLFSVLRSATVVNVPPSKARKKTYRVKQSQVIGICAAILLRHRNQSMNLVQRILSVLLYNGCASKQVNMCSIVIRISTLYQ